MEVLEMGSGNDSDQGSSGGGGGVEDQRDESGCNYWTNERHLNFLSSMEETFVRNMMESHTHRMLINAAAAANGGAAHHHHRSGHRHLVHRLESPRLDRYVPDISESTLDSQTAKNSSRSVKISDQVSRSGRRHRERPTTRHPYKISLDQVVPHAEDKAGDKDEKERERPQLREMIS